MGDPIEAMLDQIHPSGRDVIRKMLQSTICIMVALRRDELRELDEIKQEVSRDGNFGSW